MAKSQVQFSKDNEYYTPKSFVDRFGVFDYDPATTLSSGDSASLGNVDVFYKSKKDHKEKIKTDIHLKMLANSNRAKNLGELTVILLGHAVSVAVDERNIGYEQGKADGYEKGQDDAFRGKIENLKTLEIKETFHIPQVIKDEFLSDYKKGLVEDAKRHFNGYGGKLGLTLQEVINLIQK